MIDPRYGVGNKSNLLRVALHIKINVEIAGWNDETLSSCFVEKKSLYANPFLLI